MKHYEWGNNCIGSHLHRSDSLCVTEELMPPGTSELLHYHEKTQQLFYILSGTASFELDGKTQLQSAGQCIYILPKSLHKISNVHDENLRFLVVSQPDISEDRIEIIDYSEELNEPIKKLNYDWLEKYFYVEPYDELSLCNPKEEIIDKGGMIFYARYRNEIVATVSLLKETDTIFELAKMAVTENAQGHYIGNALLEHCFNVAKQKTIKKIILYSNTKMEAAIHLYRKFGFKEIAIDNGHYVRANIKMEKEIL